jgi:hypothetical protein
MIDRSPPWRAAIRCNNRSAVADPPEAMTMAASSTMTLRTSATSANRSMKLS